MIYVPLCFQANMPEREKTILQLFFVDEYSIEEIAQQLSISRQAVNQAKNRALNKIRKALEERK